MPDVTGIRGRILQTMENGLIVIQVAKPDRPMMKPFLQKYYWKAQEKAKKAGHKPQDSDYPILDFNFAYWFKKRTLDQNALYWSLLAILGYEVFGEFHHEEEIHEEILAIYSPRVEGPITKRQVPKRSRFLNTVEFSRLIEGVFKELAEHGVGIENSDQIGQYWREWMTWRGTVGDPLSGSYKDIQEYRERVPYCEACLKYLGPDNPGSIAHIVSRGAGGTLDDWNIFHFCDSCHTGLLTGTDDDSFDKATVQHMHGWAAFLEKYPHIRWKWEKAHERAGAPTVDKPKPAALEDAAAAAVPAEDPQMNLLDGESMPPDGELEIY